MKIHKRNSNEVSAKKKSKKKVKRKKTKQIQDGKIVPKIKPDVLINASSTPTLQNREFEMILTPSKSENDTFEVDRSDILSASIEDSLNISSIENSSYCYNNISEEFVIEDIDEDSGTIVSLPIVDNPINKHVSPESSSSSSPMSQPRKKKPRVRNKEINETETNTFSNDYNIIKMNNFDKDVQQYETDDGMIVILEKDKTVYLHGVMLLSILHGEIEVLGHTITKDSPEVKLYSPRGSSLLYLRNITKSVVAVANYLNLNVLKEAKLTENCAIILCKKLDEPRISFIEKHTSQQILPRTENSNLPRIVFQPNGSWNLLKPNQEWDQLIDGITEVTKLMICGGKGVGKTTFLRYAINRLLVKFKEVRVIDLDPGQSEFTIPGCLSVVKITEPVFGVNYSHLKCSEKSILSNINIGYEPKKYIASVRCLLNNMSSDAIPTLVNYMGFTHGIGINILSAVIIEVKPTDILQIFSRHVKKNYKNRLYEDVVIENAELFTDTIPTDLNYNLHQVQSMCDQNDGWTAEPRQLREMSVLSYISEMVESNSVFNTKAPMYRINMADIIIADLAGEIIHPAAVNASLVALCSLIEEATNIFQCFGWGIVRGIDIDTNILVLVTLEKPETLEKVSHVVLHGATLPPSVYMTPDDVTGPMPYVIEGLLMDFGQIPKRSRLPAKN